MLRGLIRLLLICGVVLLVLPFLVSSLYVDQRGITIPGKVFAKSETVTVHYSDWKRSRDVTIQYEPPDGAGVSFLSVHPDSELYDGLHVGQIVSLHYLQRKDVPDLPMAKFLSDIRILPTARLAGQSTFSGLENSFTPKVRTICWAIFGVAALLFLWRRMELDGFPWVVGACVLTGAAALMISDFPTPTRRPAVEVRSGAGKVKSIGRIDRLFEGDHEQGLEANQPVDVVGVEFVPEGRTDAVVAVDLIDAGSVANLREGSAVSIEYESQAPRSAYIQNAARTFVAKNFQGIVQYVVFCVLLLAGFLLAGRYLGMAWRRLIATRR